MAPNGRTRGAKAPAVAIDGNDDDKADVSSDAITDDDIAEESEQHVNGSAVEQGAASLEAQLAEERRKREAAESENATLRSQQQANTREVVDSRLAVIGTSIKNTEMEVTNIKDKIKVAKEAGDYDAEINAINELQQANIRLQRLGEGKNAIESQIEEAKRPQDEFENFTKDMPEGRGKQWLREHREFVVDQGKQQELVRAHMHALGEGHREGSEEYFAHVEQRLGLRNPPASEEPPRRDPPEVETRQQERRMPPSAPVSRVAIDNGGDLPEGISRAQDGKYRLSPEAREAARIAGVSDAEYLQSALQLQKEGQLGRRTH